MKLHVLESHFVILVTEILSEYIIVVFRNRSISSAITASVVALAYSVLLVVGSIHSVQHWNRTQPEGNHSLHSNNTSGHQHDKIPGDQQNPDDDGKDCSLCLHGKFYSSLSEVHYETELAIAAQEFPSYRSPSTEKSLKLLPRLRAPPTA